MNVPVLAKDVVQVNVQIVPAKTVLVQIVTVKNKGCSV